METLAHGIAGSVVRAPSPRVQTPLPYTATELKLHVYALCVT